MVLPKEVPAANGGAPLAPEELGGRASKGRPRQEQGRRPGGGDDAFVAVDDIECTRAEQDEETVLKRRAPEDMRSGKDERVGLQDPRERPLPAIVDDWNGRRLRAVAFGARGHGRHRRAQEEPVEGVQHCKREHQVASIVPRHEAAGNASAERNGVGRCREERQEAGHDPSLVGADCAAAAGRAEPPPAGAEPRRRQPDQPHPCRQVEGEDVRRHPCRKVRAPPPHPAPKKFQERARGRRRRNGREHRVCVCLASGNG
jgi:hypothetical protein